MDVGGTDVDVPVGEGTKTAVAVCRLDAAVPVGEGIMTEVAVIPAANVSVGDEIGSAVDVDSLDADVSVDDGNAGAVIVDALDVDVSVGDGSGGGGVVVTSLVSVAKIGVPVRVILLACGAFAGVQTSKQINISKRMIATINLNRS